VLGRSYYEARGIILTLAPEKLPCSGKPRIKESAKAGSKNGRSPRALFLPKNLLSELVSSFRRHFEGKSHLAPAFILDDAQFRDILAL
jgi:hypothetical protein